MKLKSITLGLTAILGGALVGCSGNLSNNLAGSERFFPSVPQNYDLAREQAPEGWNLTNERNVYWRWCKNTTQCPTVHNSQERYPYLKTMNFEPGEQVAIEIWSPDRSVENVYLRIKFYDDKGNYINDYNNFLGPTVDQHGPNVVVKGTKRAFVPFMFPDQFGYAELSELNIHVARFDY